MYTRTAPVSPAPRARFIPEIPTSSFPSLLKLTALSAAIEDAQTTRDKLADQIQPEDSAEGPLARRRGELVAECLVNQSRALHAQRRRVARLRGDIDQRRSFITKGYQVIEEARGPLDAARKQLALSLTSHATIKSAIKNQRRRIATDLSFIFPITPVPDSPPLTFQILGIPLPNSTYDISTTHTSLPISLSAALGHVALLVDRLQYYLSTPLPYPIQPYGSHSSVRDEISLLPTPDSPNGKTARDFPLWLPRSGGTATQFRFDYAWFLVNKDIESLCSRVGLRLVDIRHTLPNLRYLLWVCEGEGELPGRKKGVLGFNLGGVRRGSVSDVTRLRLENGEPSLRRGSWTAGTSGTRTVREEPEPEDSPVQLPFVGEDKIVTLRTRGMREQ